jgi:dTDP-4-dehydrorhamnose reductase
MNVHTVARSSERTALGTFAALELWGGAECTVNRVGDVFRDQLVETGHDARIGDFDLIAELGIKALRMPIVWERVAPDRADQRLWKWSDVRIARLRELGIRPIAGLVHHGSGPSYTSLLDDKFPVKLADYALSVAQRYPDIMDWTPVNEPVTTARFSALYGHWYPHATDEGSFWRALVNQIDGVRLAMKAIRTVTPHARLIQTDDLGRTYATPPLERQALYNNERRWAGWDMLCGRLVPGHALWDRICGFGLEGRLRSIAAHPCPPDIIGLNHYLTSDRFIDHRTGNYPPETYGGNDQIAYADVEAVRVLEPAPDGLAVALREVSERYRIPVAITEVHLGCSRDEQARWIADAWDTAETLRRSGHDIRAVTIWALFGNKGWNTLLTAPGVYESGVFDVSGGLPRPTALTRVIRTLGQERDCHPSAASAGWWRRDVRRLYPAVLHRAIFFDSRAAPNDEPTNPILILGATGTLGGAMHSVCTLRNISAVLTARTECDLNDEAMVEDTLDRLAPAAVINAAGWVRVDEAQDERDRCFAANASGAAMLTGLCAKRSIPTVNFSSDLVFGNDYIVPRVESDPINPMNIYGTSKAQMESAIGALDGDHLIVRTAAFFSPNDEHNFAVAVVRSLSQGKHFHAAHDRAITPTYVPDLCHAVLDLIIDGETGIWHLSNGDAVSWAEFARRVADASDLDPGLVVSVPGDDLGWRALRPLNCALVSERGVLMPSLESAIARFARSHLPESVGAAELDKVGCAV